MLPPLNLPLGKGVLRVFQIVSDNLTITPSRPRDAVFDPVLDSLGPLRLDKILATLAALVI
jgi:hypothetical protein